MPDLQIVPADFGDVRLHDFLLAHLDDMAPTAPSESRHPLDLDGLCAPGVRLWVGLSGSALVGTVALAALEDGHEELKSMRTDPSRRGEGIAGGMLMHALTDARSRGVQRVSLETGSMAFFAPAWALYAKAGFVECEPFGDYVNDPNSEFMSLAL